MLPKHLKSGRRLVATAAGGRVGLYRGDEDDFVLRLPSGKFKRGIVGSQGYPIAPDGHWAWLKAKKRRKRERLEAKQRRRGVERGQQVDRQVEMPPSSTNFCVDCERDVRERKHYHTVVSERGYGADSICCRCARQRRGLRCFVHERAAQAKRRRRKGL